MDPDIDQLDVVVGLREPVPGNTLLENDVSEPIDGEITGSITPRVETELEVLDDNLISSIKLENSSTIEFDLDRLHVQRAPVVFAYVSDDVVLNTNGPATKAKVSTLGTIEVEPGDLEWMLPESQWFELCDQLPPAGDGDTFECPVCGHQTRVETPYSTVDQWCEGACDTLRTFRKQ